MKDLQKPSPRKTVDKGRPDYYITPTHDFTQYTKDSQEKYWSKDTKFDWLQSVQGNLKEYLENLDQEAFSKVLFMVLPMVEENLGRKIVQIHQEQLPLEEDALKDIAECIPFDRTTIHQALLIQLPLKSLQLSVSKLKDQLEILSRERLDLQEQQRIGFFKKGTTVKHLETEAERQEQALELSRLTNQINQVQKDLSQLKAQNKIESEKPKTEIRKEFNLIESQVLVDLEETRELLQRTLQSKNVPGDPKDLARLKDLILKRQIRGLKDIANHALVVEQSAIAPLTMGIIHYKRYREIQEAMTTFINDEAKHSATFRRFLVEKLEAKEYISASLIKGTSRYMWLARFMPGVGLFLAVIVEAIGAAYLEFFGNEKYMPDNLFCSICKTISMQDEKRHMDLCVAMYNELFRKGTRRERFQNRVALKVIMKSVYGGRTEDHHLIQAFRAFGVESDILYKHIVGRLSQQLARISMYVEPERILEFIG
jgi:DNA-binding protein Fis